MDVIRVDGNDVFAVYNATLADKESATKTNVYGPSCSYPCDIQPHALSILDLC